jgi:hypothetical protein
MFAREFSMCQITRAVQPVLAMTVKETPVAT